MEYYTDLNGPKSWEIRPGVRVSGRPTGSRNRSTVISEILNACIYYENLNGMKEKFPVETHLINSLIKKALSGDVPAIKECFDMRYGKQTVNAHIDGDGGSALALLLAKIDGRSAGLPVIEAQPVEDESDVIAIPAIESSQQPIDK